MMARIKKLGTRVLLIVCHSSETECRSVKLDNDCLTCIPRDQTSGHNLLWPWWIFAQPWNQALIDDTDSGENQTPPLLPQHFLVAFSKIGFNNTDNSRCAGAGRRNWLVLDLIMGHWHGRTGYPATVPSPFPANPLYMLHSPYLLWFLNNNAF